MNTTITEAGTYNQDLTENFYDLNTAPAIPDILDTVEEYKAAKADILKFVEEAKRHLNGNKDDILKKLNELVNERLYMFFLDNPQYISDFIQFLVENNLLRVNKSVEDHSRNAIIITLGQVSKGNIAKAGVETLYILKIDAKDQLLFGKPKQRQSPASAATNATIGLDFMNLQQMGDVISEHLSLNQYVYFSLFDALNPVAGETEPADADETLHVRPDLQATVRVKAGTPSGQESTEAKVEGYPDTTEEA